MSNKQIQKLKLKERRAKFETSEIFKSLKNHVHFNRETKQHRQQKMNEIYLTLLDEDKLIFTESMKPKKCLNSKNKLKDMLVIRDKLSNVYLDQKDYFVEIKQ